MENVLYTFMAVIVALALIIYVLQMRVSARIRHGIKLMLKWFDYIIAHPTNFDLELTRTMEIEVDNYLADKDIGKKLMFFAPKLKDYIVDRYGILPGESKGDAFSRLAHWEGDKVRLDVYWTLIQGSFAEYADLLAKGKRPNFAGVSAPMAIVRKYWKV